MVEAYPDRELNEHRPQASQWVDTLLPVELHGLLRDPLFVLGVAFLDLLQLGLEYRHGLQLPALLHRERHHDHANDEREYDDTYAEVLEKNAVQQHQAVDHRPDDDSVPDVDDYCQSLFSGTLLFTTPSPITGSSPAMSCGQSLSRKVRPLADSVPAVRQGRLCRSNADPSLNGITFRVVGPFLHGTAV